MRNKTLPSGEIQIPSQQNKSTEIVPERSLKKQAYRKQTRPDTGGYFETRIKTEVSISSEAEKKLKEMGVEVNGSNIIVTALDDPNFKRPLFHNWGKDVELIRIFCKNGKVFLEAHHAKTSLTKKRIVFHEILIPDGTFEAIAMGGTENFKIRNGL